MPLTHFAAILVMTAPVMTAGCGEPSDPPGTVPPNESNFSSVSIDGDASGDDASASSGDGKASSGASSGSGSESNSIRVGMTPAPTWTEIYNTDLKNGTIGNCVGCHAPMSTASGAYSYLQGEGYISGTDSILVKSASCLSWYGGNMPPGGTRSNAMAVSDMNAWAAAGAMNN